MGRDVDTAGKEGPAGGSAVFYRKEATSSNLRKVRARRWCVPVSNFVQHASTFILNASNNRSPCLDFYPTATTEPRKCNCVPKKLVSERVGSVQRVVMAQTGGITIGLQTTHTPCAHSSHLRCLSRNSFNCSMSRIRRARIHRRKSAHRSSSASAGGPRWTSPCTTAQRMPPAHPGELELSPWLILDGTSRTFIGLMDRFCSSCSRKCGMPRRPLGRVQSALAKTTKSYKGGSPLPSRGPKNGRIGYITPAFSGVPNRRGQNQNWLHHPCLFGGPKMGGLAT